MATSSKPNFSQGWGIAGLITGMAIGAFALAGYIKSRTFHSPNDVTAPTRGSAAHAPAAAPEHAPAAAKH
jgi:hypothetical protein